MLLPKFESHDWRRINYRAADSVLTAEFLHGLYQRHDPFLNPIRFVNTVVVFRPWTVNAYAPRREWGLLAARFGGRLLHSLERVEPELERVLSRPRTRSRALAATLDSLRLDDLSDQQLLELLVEMHHVPLGEIYEVNLVQVEHATNEALRHRVTELADVLPGAREVAIAELLRTAEPTCAAQEFREFLQQVMALKATGSNVELLDEQVEIAFARHGRFGSAYGASDVTREAVRSRFEEYLALSVEALMSLYRQSEERSDQVPHRLVEVLREDPIVASLSRWSQRTGTTRDQNKRLLGEITRHRVRILTQVAARRGVTLDDLRLYLLEELCRLLEVGLRVPSPVVHQRRAGGVVLERREHVLPLNPEHERLVSSEGGTGTRGPALVRGLCASPGTVTGRVCLVRSAKDMEKMHRGDVMIAPGTDFDLVPLLLLAGGVVTEEGGVLSHAAVVARERGIPCVVGAVGAMQALRDGEHVELDASSGTVECKSRVAAPVAPAPEKRRTVYTTALDRSLDAALVGNKAATLGALAGAVQVPQGMRVLDVTLCTALLQELTRGHRDLLADVSAEIAERFSGGLLNLRSSSPAEDRDFGSAAGVYSSVIGVEPCSSAIADALERVLRSATGAAAAAYHGPRAVVERPDIAVLLTRFERFDCQGVSMSTSPWCKASVLVEVFEGDPQTCAQRGGGERVHVPRDPEAVPQSPTIGHVWSSLRDVARTTLAIESLVGQPVEVEWGLRDAQVIVLQSRAVCAQG